MSFVEGVKADLNRIRTKPASFQKLFTNMRATLERFKGKGSPLVKECEQFIQYLGKAPGIPELIVSNALIKAAEKRLDTIENLGRYEKEPANALLEYASRYGEGHKVVYECTDDGAQEPEEVLSRLMMHEEDKERFNRKVVFDSTVLYFGVGHREVGEKHLTVIFFADNINDLPEKPMNEDVTERINRLRSNPKSYTNDFQVLAKIYSRVKKSNFLADDCEVVQDMLNRSEPLPEIKISDHLTDLARVYSEHVLKERKSLLIDVNDLIARSKKLVSGFKFIVGTGAFSIIDPDRVIHSLFVNEFDNNKVLRKALLNPETKFIGIHYSQINYIPITIVVLADNAEEPELRSLDELAAVRLNEIRQSPQDLINSLTKLRDSLRSPSKQHIVDDINSLIEELQSGKKLPEFVSSRPLSEAAEEFLRINGKQTSIFDSRVYAEEKEFLETRLSHYCSGYKEVYQFVNWGSENLKEIIMQLLIDEKDPEKKFRRAILDEKLKFVGIARSEFKKLPLFTFILADNVEELKSKQFTDSLVEEINILRKTPKAYIKFFEDLLPNIPAKETTKKTNTFKIINFLKSTRFYGALQVSEHLIKAAESRINFMRESGEVKKHSQEDIRVFLSDHCSGYLNVAEISVEGYVNSKELLVNVIASDDFDTGARSYIFNQKMYWIGAAFDSERNIAVAFITDNVEEKKDDGIYVHTHWRKISRPELTEDEILQIKKDFTKLDVVNKGVIYPQHLIILINKNPEFQKKNTVYYNAIKNNTENIHFQQAGMTVDDFIDACKQVLSGFTDETWKNIFLNILNDPKKKFIDYETFRKLTNELGYHISDEECLEILKKLTDEKAQIDLNKFIEIMKLVESKK